MGQCGSNTKKSYAHSSEEDNQYVSKSLHEGSIRDMVYYGSASTLVSCSDASSILSHDARQLASTGSYDEVTTTYAGHTKAVNRILLHRDHVWSASRDLTVRKWDARTGSCLHTMAGIHEMNIAAIDIHPTMSQLASGSRDYSVKIWDLETSQQVLSLNARRNVVTSLMYAPVDASSPSAHSMLYQGSEDLCVRVWDTRLRAGAGGSSNGGGGGGGGATKASDVSSGAPTGSSSSSLGDASVASQSAPALTLAGYVYFPTCLSVHPRESHYVATGCKGFNAVGCEVKVWDVRKPSSPMVEFTGHTHDVTDCRYVEVLQQQQSGGGGGSVGPAAWLLLTCCKDGSLGLWDAVSRKKVGWLSGCSRHFTCIEVLPLPNEMMIPQGSMHAKSKGQETAGAGAGADDVRLHFAVGAYDGSVSFFTVTGAAAGGTLPYEIQLDGSTAAYVYEGGGADA